MNSNNIKSTEWSTYGTRGMLLYFSQTIKLLNVNNLFYRSSNRLWRLRKYYNRAPLLLRVSFSFFFMTITSHYLRWLLEGIYFICGPSSIISSSNDAKRNKIKLYARQKSCDCHYYQYTRPNRTNSFNKKNMFNRGSMKLWYGKLLLQYDQLNKSQIRRWPKKTADWVNTKTSSSLLIKSILGPSEGSKSLANQLVSLLSFFYESGKWNEKKGSI